MAGPTLATPKKPSRRAAQPLLQRYSAGHT